MPTTLIIIASGVLVHYCILIVREIRRTRKRAFRRRFVTNRRKGTFLADNELQLVHHVIRKTHKGVEDSDGHLLTLFSLAVCSKATTIVELGVRDASTTLPLLLGARMNNGTLTSVDIAPIDFEPPGELRQHWNVVQKDSLEFLSEWDKNKTMDLVYIDDWHAYRHVARELEFISQCVTPSSLIVLHDLMYSKWQPHYHSEPRTRDDEWAEGGPYRAVNELDKEVWEFATIPFCNGLTLLRKLATDRR